MSALYPTYDEWLQGQGYTKADDGGWFTAGDREAEGGVGQRWADESTRDAWGSQYDNVYSNSMRAASANPNLQKQLYGTAGLLAPGYMEGYSAGAPRKLYSSDEMFGRFGPMGGTLARMRGQTLSGLTPEQQAARAEFEKTHAGYAQLTSDHYTVGPDGQVRFKTAGPNMGQYIVDPNRLKYDPTYGMLTPLDNLGASGHKGGWKDTFMAFAPMAMMALGANFFGGGGAAGAGGGSGAGAGALASEAGFLPGSFELGASSYGGSAAAGLNAAAGEWLGSYGLGSSWLTDFPMVDSGPGFGESVSGLQGPAPVTELGKPAGLTDKLRLNPAGISSPGKALMDSLGAEGGASKLGSWAVDKFGSQLALGALDKLVGGGKSDLDLSGLLPSPGGSGGGAPPVADAAAFATLPPGVGVKGMTRANPMSGALSAGGPQSRAVRPYNIRKMYGGGGQQYTGAIAS